MSRMESKLRQIENCLIGIAGTKCQADIDGKPRTILPNAKIRELKNLCDKVYEAQMLINSMNDLERQRIYQQQLNGLEEARQEMLQDAQQKEQEVPATITVLNQRFTGGEEFA